MEKIDTVSDRDVATFLSEIEPEVIHLAKIAKTYAPQAQRTAEELRIALTAIIRCGKILLRAKARCTQGELRPWYKHIGLHERKAERYMSIARHEVILKNDGEVLALSLRDALRLIEEINEPLDPSKKPVRSRKPTVEQFRALDFSEGTETKDGWQFVLTIEDKLWRKFLRACKSEKTKMSQSLKLALLNYINRFDRAATAYSIGYEDALAGRKPQEVSKVLRDVESERLRLTKS